MNRVSLRFTVSLGLGFPALMDPVNWSLTHHRSGISGAMNQLTVDDRSLRPLSAAATATATAAAATAAVAAAAAAAAGERAGRKPIDRPRRYILVVRVTSHGRRERRRCTQGGPQDFGYGGQCPLAA